MSLEKRLLFGEINQKAHDFNYKNENETAIIWYEKGVNLALELHTFPKDLSRFQDIEGHYTQEEDYNQNWTDICSQIVFFSQYAGCLCQLKKLDKALEIAQIAEHFLEKTDLFRAFRDELYNLGSVYFQRKEFSKAIEFYQKTTTKYNLDIGNSGKTITYAFIRLGLCYLLMQENSLSQEAFLKAEEVAKLNSVGKSALLYYFLQKISQNNEKQAKKYHKMYLNRLKKEDKISLQEQFEDNFIPLSDQKQILSDFESISIENNL